MTDDTDAAFLRDCTSMLTIPCALTVDQLLKHTVNHNGSCASAQIIAACAAGMLPDVLCIH